LYVFFWVIPRRLNFICQRFGTLCSIFTGKYVYNDIIIIIHLPAYEDGTECSETSAYKIQTPGNHQEENIQHTEHDESLKSRILSFYTLLLTRGSSVCVVTRIRVERSRNHGSISGRVKRLTVRSERPWVQLSGIQWLSG
jgi:hypothetical protein